MEIRFSQPITTAKSTTTDCLVDTASSVVWDSPEGQTTFRYLYQAWKEAESSNEPDVVNKKTMILDVLQFVQEKNSEWFARECHDDELNSAISSHASSKPVPSLPLPTLSEEDETKEKTDLFMKSLRQKNRRGSTSSSSSNSSPLVCPVHKDDIKNENHDSSTNSSMHETVSRCANQQGKSQALMDEANHSLNWRIRPCKAKT